MKMVKTAFKDLFVCEIEEYSDHRGTFIENFRAEWFNDVQFVQDNFVTSYKGVVRGLHFQWPPFAQSKLIRVVEGEILDIAVDLRKNSDTYGKAFEILLTESCNKQIFIPKGFAHGYATLSNRAKISYKVDQYYYPNFESGIHPLCPMLSLDWQTVPPILSEKDHALSGFGDFKSPF